MSFLLEFLENPTILAGLAINGEWVWGLWSWQARLKLPRI